MILGAIAFRASLEVTEHPRVLEFSQRLLPWLDEIGSADELDPTERELLATPLGQLSDSQRMDANWAGESAALFCWMLNLGEPLEEASAANQSDLSEILCILRPGAMRILQSASLRSRTEIEDTCGQFALILSLLRESRVGPPASDIIRRLAVQELSDVWFAVTKDAVRRASDAVARMTAQVREQMAGVYFVRGHAALWFLSGRRGYYR